jgi:phospholipase/carboxylesterase
MNRIFADAASTAATLLRVDPPAHRAQARHGSLYTLCAPLHYEPNYAYPLVVWLHGDGGDERQLARVMPHISMRNYVAAGVRGTRPCTQRPGFCWQQTDEDICAAEQRVLEAIAAASARFHVHPERIFLAGYECGGTMAYRLALRAPQRFAGALSAGGPFPSGRTPLANLERLRDYPLFLAICRDSERYTTEDVCRELVLFHAASLRVAVRQYPCGDELTTQMLHDMNVWMMERVTGMPGADEEEVRNLSELN